jgi:hypothetical protein
MRHKGYPIPIVAAWLLFNEEFNTIKLLAFFDCTPALLILDKKENKTTNGYINDSFSWFWRD